MKAESLLESFWKLFGISEWWEYFIHEVIPRTVLFIPFTLTETRKHIKCAAYALSEVHF